MFSLQPVVLFGTEEQQQRMIPPVVSRRGEDVLRGDRAQRRAGHDQAQDPRASKVDGGYLVNGEKIWITNAHVANKMLLLARTTPLDQVKQQDRGLSLFYTELDRTKIEAG